MYLRDLLCRHIHVGKQAVLTSCPIIPRPHGDVASAQEHEEKALTSLSCQPGMAPIEETCKACERYETQWHKLKCGRWMGSMRFTLGAIHEVLKHRKFAATVAYMPAARCSQGSAEAVSTPTCHSCDLLCVAEHPKCLSRCHHGSLACTLTRFLSMLVSYAEPLEANYRRHNVPLLPARLRKGHHPRWPVC